MLQNPRILLVLAFLCLLPLTRPCNAQSTRLQHTITKTLHQAPLLGRDYWFCLMTNYGTDLGGKYFALYVTSRDSVVVKVEFPGVVRKSITVKPYKTAVFNIPLSWEMPSSGKIEDRAIHVWADKDIECHVMSHNAYTSDGFTVIPSIGWGTEYVVAGFASLFEGGGSYVYDLPSQFAIVAKEDDTRVTVTPTVDIRFESSVGANCSAIFAQKGQPTQFTLHKGQCMQCKTTCVQDCDNFDLTGTVIKSSNPVGLIAGSMCPNIPCDFPYCDHVCEMIPPVRTWGKTYYTIPFYQPPGAALSHSASTFLVIASKNSQKIYRFEADAQQASLFCQLDKYQTYWRNDIAEGSKFYSSDPFLLVQYVNSASYPDNVNGNGDPAEVAVPPVEGFQKETLVQFPTTISNVGPYNNYLNIIANVNDKHVMVDSVSVLAKATRVAIDGQYVGYRMANLQTGAHRITSDMGVVTYMYGYGYDETYGWSGNMGNGTTYTTDSLAPFVFITDNCFTSSVSVFDTGKVVDAPGVYYLRLDSLYNMSYTPDTSLHEGIPRANAFYSLTVLDPSQPASLQVTAFDQSGNSTRIVSTYNPRFAFMAPAVLNFGNITTGTTAYRYVTINNNTAHSYTIDSIRLLQGDQGFTIDSIVKTPLDPGTQRNIKIAFTPADLQHYTDTLFLQDDCGTLTSVLTGQGNTISDTRNFFITNIDFVTDTAGKYISGQARVVNLSTNAAITIDSMWVEDAYHFSPAPDTTKSWVWIDQKKDSLTIPVHGTATVNFVFHTDTAGSYWTQWFAHSADIMTSGEDGVRTNVLSATALTKPHVMRVSDESKEFERLWLDGRTLRTTLQTTAKLELIDLLGNIALSVMTLPNKPIDLHSIQSGMYLYRLATDREVLTGKIAIP